MNKKIKSEMVMCLAIVLSTIGGYSLVKYGMIGVIPLVLGILVLVAKWRYETLVRLLEYNAVKSKDSE